MARSTVSLDTKGMRDKLTLSQLATNGTTYWLSGDHPFVGNKAFEVYQAGALRDHDPLGQASIQQLFELTQG